MIDLQLYAAFVAAVTILMLIPGPNVALIVANSVAHGARYGLLTVLGTSSAMVLQLAVTALGMTELLATLGSWFEWLRWIGVAYLLYLGVSYWRAVPVDLTRTAPERKSPRAMVVRALLVSLSNPKTLLFYGAFFPQFLVGRAGCRQGDRAVVRDLPRTRDPGRWRLGVAGGAGAALPREPRPAAQPPVGRIADRRWYRLGAGAQELVIAGLTEGKGAACGRTRRLTLPPPAATLCFMATHLQQRIDARIIGRAPIGLPEAVIRVSTATLEYACHVTL
jgi:homoserine/homoserine lactone efflux protein